ncbi:Dam family site-specific DNA-(adenine-N6)-methyltransferase [Rhodoluna sp.]|uniref:DNA adenine methylase n=1 Tax=Rhodoluna sp. TaxID=1969481 RepID=UPI0026001D58|nr:Dam family site-specific DNA-(adenine-N6)-methyltransferase [Rhodoluna sp.]
MTSQGNAQATPFLKWAGGKRVLVKQILQFVPNDVDEYYEPFLGAGSLFFSLPAETPKIVSDFNAELISVYETIRDDVDGLLRELRKRTNSLEDYLEIRDWDRSPSFARRSKTSRAARFIALNRLGFNGLYRVNSKGQYNVPYGHPKKVDLLMEDNLRAVSAFLSETDSAGRPAVEFHTGGYKDILQNVSNPRALVYCDPPYHPTTATSFKSYTRDGFNEENQIELHDEVVRLTKLGVRVLLSNSDTEFIRRLYSEKFFTVNELVVRRAIAANSENRGLFTEVLIDNFKAIRRS